MTGEREEQSASLFFGRLALVLFVATVFAANWAVERFGVVPVGFGHEAPAAVYFVGIALTLRDTVHRILGRWWVIAAIAIGAVASYAVAPRFAAASAAAFIVSELADLAVYTPLRERGWIGAVAASNVVGAVVDSLIFLQLAFGSLEFLEGQLVGKLTMTAAAIALLLATQRGSRYA